MGFRWRVAIFWLVATLGFARQAEPDAETIIRRSLERDADNTVRLRNYTYTEVQRTDTFAGSGAVLKSETSTFDVVNLYGSPYRRRIAKNGRPLEGKEKRKADEEFEREVRKRQGETPGERAKREAEEQKNRAEARRFLQEVPKAYYLQTAGTDAIDGLPVWIIEATPRPDFQSSVKHADLLRKVRGRVWVDQSSYQWVRAEAEAIQPISFGGFLAKLDRGARLTFLQTRVNDEVWLPAKATVRVDGRLLLKHFRLAAESTWSNYRKFQVDSRLVPAEEAAAPRP